jgi:sulfide:quinone oxidoreductase
MASRTPLCVAVVGGGFAAGELLLALRALAEDRVTLELVAPDTRLPFRAAATGEPFGAGAVQTFDLARLAADAGAKLRRGVVDAVAPRARRMRLASGKTVSYDALVVAVGARATTGVAGAVTFRDQRDGHHIGALADEIAAGEVRRVVFAAPTGVAWTLPLYELALLAAAKVDRAGIAADVAIATPERRALEVFGDPVGDAVEQLLEARDVRLVRRSRPWRATRDGLELGDGGSIAADRVVAIPRLVGRRLSGVPADWNGFIHTDALGRVPEAPGVFAAGDVTAFPVKQGGIAAQQADVIAHVLARQAGAPLDPPAPPQHVLRSRLLGADGPLYLRAVVDGEGRPIAPADDAPAVGPEAPWWPAAKLFGRHLTPWMAAQPAGAPALPSTTSSPVGRTAALP